ncbi:trehalose-phosphatase [Halobaculum rarum]|uniref:trehalose-phosphatase n=1 Tax=Halobaculum rarum TaxID=3075122 RepID=UPI0032AFAE75
MTAPDRRLSSPDSLPEGIRDLLAGAEGLLLGLDFDGTLAPIVDDPGAATLAPEVRPTVERLATQPGVALAVVSGRALSDLRDRVGIDGVVYAGNHGLELGYGGERAVHPATLDRQEEIDRLCVDLADRLADVPGCRIENKGVTATVHFRTVPEEAVPTVVDAVERAVADTEGVRVTEGDCIREIRPAVAWDKGEAMRSIASVVHDDRPAMYVGDDVTDEDAFATIQPEGAGVHVAHEGATVETVAAYRLDGRASVPPFLELLAEATADFEGEPGWRGTDPLAGPFGWEES